ncbi:MAG: hypothetical protein ACFFBD_10895 [Candidatus Hodarchaeota archaeon]
MQKKLEGFLNPLDSTSKNLKHSFVSHRDLILFLLQLGNWVKESALYNALTLKIEEQRRKGKPISPLSRESLQRHLLQLLKEGILESKGFCWRLKLF